MTPDNWGPVTWYAIHFIALAYPDSPTEENKYDYKRFFENFWKVIPCYKCAVNYKRHLNEMPLTDSYLANNDTLFAWTVMLHNIVNQENGKPTMSVEDARALYVDANFAKKVAERKCRISGGKPQESFDTMSAFVGVLMGVVIGIMVTWYFVVYSKRR